MGGVNIVPKTQIISHRAKPGGFQMLVLTRRQGESLSIGKNTKITILNIDNGDKQIKLGVNGSESVTIDKWKSKVIADGIEISVEKINKYQVKLGIKAPESMKVDREECVGGRCVVFCFKRN